MSIESDLAKDRSRALTLVPVSHETESRLDLFVNLFLRWQKAVQLVAPSTLSKLWTRHIADSLQLVALAPMEKQLSLAYPLLSAGARGIFLKGQDVDSELTEAAKSWSIDTSIQPSLTDARGRIVVVNRAQPLGKR